MPDTWTRQRVCGALVAAFRRPAGEFLATPGQVEAQLNWQIRIPQLDRADWRFLMSWAECQAARTSIEERRRDRGWSHWEFQRGWRRAAETIAAGLNRERVNTAILLAGEAAEARLESGGWIDVPPTGFAPRQKRG